MNLIVVFLIFLFSGSAYAAVPVCEQEKIKVLFVVTKFPYGLQTFVVSQIRGLIDRGYDVKIFAKIAPDPTLPEVLKDYDFLDRVFYEGIPLEHGNFDIILCQIGTLARDCLALLNDKKIFGKLLVFFRGHDLSAYLQKDPHAYDDVIKKADLLLPVCDYFADRLRSLGASSEKIVTLHSSTDVEKFFFRERAPAPDGIIRLITVCRLTGLKGIEYAVQAVARILQNHKNIEYTIVGDGNIRNQLSRLIDKLGIRSNVRLVGRQTHEEVVRLLDQSHIFIHPSVTAASGEQEGIPNAIQEAMAMGLQIISTYHSGIPELVEHGISGFLAPEKDIKALTEYLDYLIKNPATWPAMGRAGRAKVVQDFETKKEHDQLEQIFSRLLFLPA
ncbi:glycosyltransferase [Candidatus Babeliales bacterium]|nr:glycosyltransferase [Candidatus Babeliales bacterium]